MFARISEVASMGFWIINCSLGTMNQLKRLIKSIKTLILRELFQDSFHLIFFLSGGSWCIYFNKILTNLTNIMKSRTGQIFRLDIGTHMQVKGPIVNGWNEKITTNSTPKAPKNPWAKPIQKSNSTISWTLKYDFIDNVDLSYAFIAWPTRQESRVSTKLREE